MALEQKQMHSRAIAWATRKTPELCPGKKHEGKGVKETRAFRRWVEMARVLFFMVLLAWL